MRPFVLQVNIKFPVANVWKNHENVFLNIVGMMLFKKNCLLTWAELNSSQYKVDKAEEIYWGKVPVK